MNSNPKGYVVSESDPNVRHYAAGATIIEEDTPDDGCIYILTSGTLAAFKEGRQLRTLEGAGLMFGEMATILNTNRTATIRALTDCRITVYTGGLRRIIEQFPSVTTRLITSLAQRVQELTVACIESRNRLDAEGMVVAGDVSRPPEQTLSSGPC